jgi:3-hydroxybutyryl-CoA dehydrogenase
LKIRGFAQALFSIKWSWGGISEGKRGEAFTSMTRNSLAITGESRLSQELLEFSREAGLNAVLISELAELTPATPVVIETSASGVEKKKSILQRLDLALPAPAVIITSCLGFATTLMASWTAKPERIVGFATFYPFKDRKVIELTAGIRTEESAIRSAEQLFKSIGKETVRVKDTPGLTFPRILSLIINEAARSLEEGVATAEEIDVAMRLGVNYPHGPLRWADQIGLDEVLAVLEGLQRETGDDRYRPTPLLKKLVIAGFLGETCGKGFYSYNEGQVKP